MKRLNKKGGEKIISIWWFFILAIVGLAIVGMVILLYHYTFDIRQFEAEILGEKISNCLVDGQGFLREGVEENFDIFSFCKIEKGVFGEGALFYFSVKILKEDSSLLIPEIYFGDRSFDASCPISEGIKADYLPRCSRTKTTFFYFESGEKTKGSVEILSASNNQGVKLK